MNSDIDKFLDEIDRWKFKLYEKLKGMTKEEEQVFWQQSNEKARALGLPVVGQDTISRRKPKSGRHVVGEEDYDPDDLLDHVDQWKFKLHDKLARMTPAQRAAFWKAIEAEARSRGLKVVGLKKASTRKVKPRRR